MDVITTHHGDCRAMLQTLLERSVQTVVTSPPYYGLRKYSDDPREIGQEAAPDCLGWARREPPCGACYVCAMRAVFAGLWRVLRDDGTVWLNLGDSYAGSWGNYGTRDGKQRGDRTSATWVRPAYDGNEGYTGKPGTARVEGIPDKNLLGIPWRVALALQADGWYLRSDVIWNKPNCMPESVTDRPTRAHEYVFLLAKSARYFYDAAAIAESAQGDGRRRGATSAHTLGLVPGQTPHKKLQYQDSETDGTRNKRTVWTIPTQPFSGARLAADYVGRDGKPYKASPDCPVHSHLARKRTVDTRPGDAQLDHVSPDTEHMYTDLASEHDAEQPSMSIRDNSDSLSMSDCRDQQSVSSHSAGNTSESKTRASQNCDRTSIDPGYTSSRTENTQSVPASTDHSLRLTSQSHAPTATPHSNQSHKTDTLFDEHQTASDQAASDTGYIEQLPGFAEPDSRTSLNKSEEGSEWHVPVTTGDRMPAGNADKHIAYVPPSKGVDKQCTCIISQIDHYATMPEALIEPCILAGSAAQACEHCGAAWGRVVEKDNPRASDEYRARATTPKDANSGGMAGRGTPTSGLAKPGWRKDGTATNITTGFAPRCACADNTGSAASVVLDPFGGSGTVGKVAMRYQRDAVLIELNGEYIDQHIETRTDGVQLELFV